MSNWGKWEELIKCPWCGWEDQDSWERNGQDGCEINCGECDRLMTLSVDFEVRYATEKVEENQAKSAQQNNQKCDSDV